MGLRYIKLDLKFRALAMLFAFGLLLAAVGTAGAQTQVSSGRGLDANSMVGSRGVNPGASPGINPALNNQIISGNVTTGKYFRGVGAVGDPRVFQGSLGTNALAGFQRDSYGLSSGGSTYGVAQPFYLPSNTILGVRGIASGAARAGSNIPGSTTLAPPVGEGSQSSRRPTVELPWQQTPELVDTRVDLRTHEQMVAEAGMRSEVVTGSNLFGLRQVGTDLGDVPIMRKPVDSAGVSGPPGLLEKGGVAAEVRSFRALPEWARPGDSQQVEPEQVGGIELYGPTVPEGEGDEQPSGVRQNGQGSGQLAGGIESLPSLADIYERMVAESVATEGSEGQAVTGGEGQEQETDAVLSKMLFYNSFVGSRRNSFNENMAQGETLLKQSYYYQAARAYERAISVNPENPLGYMGRAYSLIGAGDLVSAADSLAMGLEIFPEQAGRKIALPEFYRSQEELDRIIEKLQRLIEAKESGDTRLRLLLGYIYIYGGEEPLGKATLEETAKLAREDPSVSPEMAQIIAKFAKAVAERE